MKYHFEFDLEFQRNPYSGLYIALEGIDGSGKTSQIEHLKKYFESRGKTVITTREPRKETGLVAEINNKALQGTMKIPRSAYQYLFTADRIMHLDELVLPALRKGHVVISDRCIWSAIPYGMSDVESGFDDSLAQVILVAQGTQNIVIPDITFYIDITAETSLERMGGRSGAKEVYESEDTLRSVVEGYHWLLHHFPDLFARIDGEKPIEEVSRNMIQIVESISPK